jgi:hypothetical protein
VARVLFYPYPRLAPRWRYVFGLIFIFTPTGCMKIEK